jgi:phosphoglycerate dehydrogenase-like enzyme
VLVAPERPAFAVDAVRQGGGELAEYGEAVDALVWVKFNINGLRETIVDHPGIRWVQLPVAGIESFVETGIFSAASSDDVVWTCAKGTYAQHVAEMALGLAIAGLREFPERARAKTWGGQAGISLYDQPVTVLGGGGITEEGPSAPSGRRTCIRSSPAPWSFSSRSRSPPKQCASSRRPSWP